MKLLAVVSALVTLVGAIPVDGPHLEARDITPGPVFNNIELFAEYSAGAYCQSNLGTFSNSNAPKAFTCRASTCHTIASSTNKPQIVFSSNMFTLNPFMSAFPPSLYIARDTNHSAIIVAFQGTNIAGLNFLAQQAQNFGSLIFSPTPFRGTGCPGCLVAEGYLASWAKISARVVTAVQTELQKQPGFRVIFTGHSLGGALAGIAAAEARANNTFGTNTQYSYGAPAIGNGPLAVKVTQQSSNTFRVTHIADSVPNSLFTMGGTATDQYSPEYFINVADAGNVLAQNVVNLPPIPGTNSIIQSPQGDTTAPLAFSLSAHSNYIIPITQC